MSNKRWIKHVSSVNVVLGFVSRIHKMHEDVNVVMEYINERKACDLSGDLFDDLKLDVFCIALDEFFDKHVNVSPEYMNTDYLYIMKDDLNELLNLTVEMTHQMNILYEIYHNKYNDLELLNDMIDNVSDALVYNKKLVSLLNDNSEALSKFNLSNDIRSAINCFNGFDKAYVLLLNKFDNVFELNNKKNELITYISVFNQDLSYFEKSVRLQIQYVEEFINVLNRESNLMIDRLFNVPDFAERLLNLQKVVSDE